MRPQRRRAEKRSISALFGPSTSSDPARRLTGRRAAYCRSSDRGGGRLALRGRGGFRLRGDLLDAPRQQHLFGDDETLDLARPLVELHDLRVAHQFLDRVLLDEAVAAVDL